MEQPRVNIVYKYVALENIRYEKTFCVILMNNFCKCVRHVE